MKEHESEIIRHIRQGKRVNISEIARKLSVPISTVNDRIKRIEEKYVLKRSSLLDFPSTGYLANALLAIGMDNPQKPEFLSRMRQDPNVNSIYHTNSDYSFLVEIVCRDTLEMTEWIRELKSRFSAEVKVFPILKVVEKERFVP